MVNKILLGVCLILLLAHSSSGAENADFSLDRYYNNAIFENQSIPKPLVKIGEPFTLRFDMKVDQECKMHVKLSDLGVHQGIESFVIIDGPSKLGDSFSKVYEENESFSYEWTLKATDRWAGGSMPIDFHYEMQLKGVYGSVINSGFTAAVVTVSDEYYDGPEISNPEADQQSNTESPSTPAFTLLAACLAFAGVILYGKYQ